MRTLPVRTLPVLGRQARRRPEDWRGPQPADAAAGAGERGAASGPALQPDARRERGREAAARAGGRGRGLGAPAQAADLSREVRGATAHRLGYATQGSHPRRADQPTHPATHASEHGPIVEQACSTCGTTRSSIPTWACTRSVREVARLAAARTSAATHRRRSWKPAPLARGGPLWAREERPRRSEPERCCSMACAL